MMAAFFFLLGMLIQCGPMPMSWSDCEDRPPQQRRVLEATRSGGPYEAP